MRKNDRPEAVCAVVLIVMAFVLVFGRYGAVQNERALLQDVPGKYPCLVNELTRWATVTEAAPLFEGCGMYTPMVGMARVGEGVQILSEHDGWAWVWHAEHLDAPVYVRTSCLNGVR